jgi:hypothetical protein
MVDSGNHSTAQSQAERTIEFDSFWAGSGLYLLWNRLFPALGARVVPPTWLTCGCRVSEILDDVRVVVRHIVFFREVTMLELEFTALDESKGKVKLHAWNTTVDLRKCVNKNIRVRQIEKMPSICLYPGEPKCVWTAYNPVKMNKRLRWLDIFVSINRGRGQFAEGKLRIPYNTLAMSMETETCSELDNVVPELAASGLLFLYCFSFLVALLVGAVLRHLGLAWYYQLLIQIAAMLSCAVWLRRQFTLTLAEIGYEDQLSIRTIYRRPHSVFDPATRTKERRKNAIQRLSSHLKDAAG